MILVTGAAGQVGCSLREILPTYGLQAEFLTHRELDITDYGSVASCVRSIQPRLIINAAAYTAVDKAESERERAMKVNAEGPANLAQAASSAGAILFQISSDYVFDGTKATAWRECDPTAPLNVYGATKAAGEAAVRKGIDQHVILRTSWVFSPFGRNFVKTMLRLGRERDELRVVSDQKGCPTGGEDIAHALASMASRALLDDKLEWGTYHFTCRGSTSWHGFAELIFEIAATRWGRRPTVKAISTADYPTAARRPQNSVLDCSRFDGVFSFDRRDWQTSVDETMLRLLVEG